MDGVLIRSLILKNNNNNKKMRAVHIIKYPALVKLYSHIRNSLFKSLTFITIHMCTSYTIILSLQIDCKVFEGKDYVCCKCSGTFQSLCFLWIWSVQELTENEFIIWLHMYPKVSEHKGRTECFFLRFLFSVSSSN